MIVQDDDGINPKIAILPSQIAGESISNNSNLRASVDFTKGTNQRLFSAETRMDHSNMIDRKLSFSDPNLFNI